MQSGRSSRIMRLKCNCRDGERKNSMIPQREGVQRLKKELKTEIRKVIKNNNHSAQKKYLANQKQLRVWLDSDKFETFKKVAELSGTSMHRLINDYVDEYIFEYKIADLDKKGK